MNIHPLAVVSEQATLGCNVSVGAFSIIEADVVVGDNCVIEPRVSIRSGTVMGANNRVFEGSVIGGLPQHTRPPEQIGRLVIGSGNIFRENCTVHRALKVEIPTTIGDNNFLMVGAHVAHDCLLGNNIIFANNAMIGGHVTVEDRAYVSGAVAVHQFCRIGRFAMVGGHARVVQDVPPYVTIDGDSGHVVGLNLVGLRRNGFTPDQVGQLKAAYRLIYRRGLKWSDVIQQLKLEYPTGPAAAFHEFFAAGHRGFVQERRLPPNATLKLRRQPDADTATAGELKAKVG